MSVMLDAIVAHAVRASHAIALRGAAGTMTYAALADAIETLAPQLARGRGALGLLLDNAPAWAVIDIAAQCAGRALVPLPAFFSDAQLQHALDDAGVDSIITDQPQRFEAICGTRIRGVTRHVIAATACSQIDIEPRQARTLPREVAKITYTSGTTGMPKGVCLGSAAIQTVATSLVDRVGREALERHLSALPLALLLENIAGIYLPLLAGGCSTLLPLASIGIHGASGVDGVRLAEGLRQHAATSVVLIPQMLQALVEQAAALPSARFIAVGGAPVSRALLSRARQLGMPVYEGYGLSECASVVAVNAPGADRLGSVGLPLGHVRIRFGDDGEIYVAGSNCFGYLHAPSVSNDGWWPTGDIGHRDADGFLYITGRKKHMFITAFGRNVAPEWIERELTLEPTIAQALVYGEGRPWNAAVLVPRSGDVAAAVAAANARLPDYAHVAHWIVADEAFTVANGLWTGTGRPRRAAILDRYGARLRALYETHLSEDPA